MSTTATNEREMSMAKERYTWIFVKKWGKTYVAPAEYPEWIHNFSPTEKKYWKYIPELDVYRCNVSAL